jgi:hypothetical protein
MRNVLIRCRFAGAVIVGLLVGVAPVAAQDPPPPDAAKVIAEYKWEPQGLFPEPDAITRAAIFGDRHLGGGGGTSGFYVKWDSDLVPGAGWISVGPGYRRWYSGDRAVFDTSAAISWRGYKTAQAKFEMPKFARSRVALGSLLQWQEAAQLAFYGEGPESLESNVSEYRLRSTNVAGYATVRPLRWMAIDAQVGWLKPSVLRRSGFFKRDRPDAADVFPTNIVYGLPDQPSFVHAEAAVRVDNRDYPGHPTRGGIVRAAASRYADRESGRFSFSRYEGEAAQFVPLAASRLVLAFHGWLVASDTGEGQTVPFYLQPSLGGRNSLRSFPDYRFRDHHLLLFNAEARIAMWTHVDAAVFADAGSVAPRVANLNLAKRSYGAGLRLHSRRQTFARLDVAHGDEGWHMLFRLSDPLTLSRATRRGANAPFVP